MHDFFHERALFHGDLFALHQFSVSNAYVGEDGESWAAGEVRQHQYLADRSEKNISIFIFPHGIGWHLPLPNGFLFRSPVAEISR